MKNFLSKLWSLSRTDRVRTLAIDAVSLPSFCRVNMLKLVSVLVILLTLGVGNAWADYSPGSGYTLVTNISSLSTGDYVILFCIQNGEGVTGWNNSKDATVSTTDAEWKEYYVTKSTSSFTLKDETANKFIASPGGNEFKYGATGGACTVESSGLLTCNSRNLKKNGSNYRFYTATYTNMFYVYKKSASCAKKVTITKGTPETGGSFSLDKTGEQNCCDALVVTVSNIVAPSGKKFSAITQSGIASGVTIDQSAKTVTYAANTTGSSTINVTYEDKGCTDHGASSITTGSSTSRTTGPLEEYYNYSTRQILYSKTDLGLPSGKKGTIKSISFKYAGSSAMSKKTSVDIYLANTALTTLSTSSVVPFSSFTKVYSGSLNCAAAGWHEFLFNVANFEYNGIGSLAVMIDDNSGAYDGQTYTFYINSATGSQIHKSDDGTNENPSTINWSSGATVANERPHAQFCILEADMMPSTVTLMDNGATITEVSAGAGVTLPSRAGCTGYTFAGWTKTWVAPQSSWTTTAPTIIPAGSYTPTADENLYPVYTKTEGGGDGFKLSLNSGGTEYYIGEKGSGAYMSAVTNAADAVVFTFANGYLSFDDSGTKKYISSQGDNTTLTIGTEKPAVTWTESGTTTFTYQSSATGTRYLAFNSTANPVRFAPYGSSYAHSYTKHSLSTTSYISVPNCCDPLGAVTGVIGTNTPTSVTLTWSAVSGAEKYQVKVPGSSSHNDWTDAVSGVSVTKSCGTAYTAYFRAIDTNGSHCAEGPESTLAIPAVSYTVGYSVTNGSKTSGDATTCGPLTAVFSANSGYHLPDKAAITVTGASDFSWTKATGTLTITAGQITGNINISFTCPADACTDAFSLHTGTKGGSDWLFNKCFSDADWGAVDDAIWVGEFPSTNECYVGYAGGDSYHGAYWAVGGIKTYNIPNGRTLGWNGSDYYSDYPATALGTFHIYKNSTDANYYLRFKPTTYVLRTGANSTWTSRDMTVSGINSNYYESDFVTLTSTLISEHAYVDLKANNGDGHVWCNFSNDRTASGYVKVKNGASTFRATDLQASDNGTYGKFQIDITQDVDNWKLAFVPYYRITYNANGGSGSTAASSYVEVGSTAAAAANGFTAPTGKQFGGWATSAGGSKAYDPTDAVTLNSNVELFAVWTDINYTVTVNQNPSVGATTTGQTTTAHYNGTINLTTTVPSGYRFVNWTTSDGFSITNPTSATTASFTMPNKNVTVTANFQQTHTVTWNVNGATVSAASLGLASNPVVFDHGASLVLPPTDPSVPGGCPDKVFVGWTSDSEITTETSSEPTLISAGAAVNANVTYRAVFADEGSGGTKWVRVEVATPGFSLSSVSEGQYAIVDADGHAFNGTISSGHGQATATTATFTNNEAPSMPSGYCELTFIKVMSGEDIVGYKMYDAANERYLYAQAASSGQLAWHSSETSYWYWYGSNWEYQLNNATLRVYNHTFRTYGNSSNQTIWLARKTTGIAYDNYITLCSSCTTPSNLAVGSITSTGGTVTWDGVSLSPTEGFKIAWNTSNSVPSPLTASNSADVAAGTNSYAITGLTPATRYYVFVKSKCNDTWSSSTNFYTNAKITYAAGTGASGSMDPKEVSYNTDVVVDACTFEAPTGKTFNGWVSNTAVHVNGGGSTTTAVPAEATINNLTAAITLTAQWRDLAQYHVTFSADNGTVAGGASQTVTEGGTLTFPNVTSTTCGTFSGWVEAAYDNTAAPSGATYHAVGDELAADPSMDGKTYYAVYHVAMGAPTTTTDVLVYSDFNATGSSYVATNNLRKSSAAVYEAVTAKQYSEAFNFNKISDARGIVTPTSGGVFKSITLTTNTNHSATRKVYVYGSSSYTAAYADPAAFKDNSSVRGTLLATLEGATKTYSTSTDDYEYIAIFADGAAYMNQIDITWYGAPMKYQTSPACTPVVSMTSSLSSFTYVYGNGPSASQSFTVSGTNLSTNPLVVTAPTNYEVCKTSGGDYTTSVSYTPSDGTVTDQTVYIRLKAGLNVGTYNYAAASGVSAASSGATTRTAALNGSVTKATGSIAFTDFNAGDHYEAEWTGSAILVPYNYILTGDGTLTTTKVDGRGGAVDTETKKWSLTNEGTYTLRLTLAAGANYTGAGPVTADFVIYKADRFYDNLHGNDVIVKRNDTGEDHYTIPSLTDESRQTSGSCSETHYHFMGWVPESALSTLSNDAAYDAVMITGGGTQAASGTNYYAVWAEE